MTTGRGSGDYKEGAACTHAPSQAEWDACLARVQPEERQRIGKFNRGGGNTGRVNPDAKSSLIGRLMIRKLCRCALGLRDDEVVLTRTKEGKPYLARDCDAAAAAPPLFNFNVSHSGGRVLLASEPRALVGVDVMEIALVPARRAADVADFFGSMRDYFTPAEWAVIDAPPQPADRVFAFFCFCESIIKAMGIGLGYDLLRANA
eukprot:gene28249-10156_t